MDRVTSNVPTVERRRRDKINNWIVQLSKAIPDCNIDYTKTGQVSQLGHSGLVFILAKIINPLKERLYSQKDKLHIVTLKRVEEEVLLCFVSE